MGRGGPSRAFAAMQGERKGGRVSIRNRREDRLAGRPATPEEAPRRARPTGCRFRVKSGHCGTAVGSPRSIGTRKLQRMMLQSVETLSPVT